MNFQKMLSNLQEKTALALDKTSVALMSSRILNGTSVKNGCYNIDALRQCINIPDAYQSKAPFNVLERMRHEALQCYFYIL